jgi:hypothetical protein
LKLEKNKIISWSFSADFHGEGYPTRKNLVRRTRFSSESHHRKQVSRSKTERENSNGRVGTWGIPYEDNQNLWRPSHGFDRH